jgi:uncharacterized tellurite resistance protein B-like protein
MLRKLRDLLAPTAAPTDPVAVERQAVAALLVELARADFDHTAAESQAGVHLLARHFGISDAEASALLAEAGAAVDGAVSLYEFTAPLRKNLSYEQKQHVIGLLWELALSDRTLDKYEDYLVSKVAELLYVARGDVIRLRVQVQSRLFPAG